jgi:hypothetical protein
MLARPRPLGYSEVGHGRLVSAHPGPTTFQGAQGSAVHLRMQQRCCRPFVRGGDYGCNWRPRRRRRRNRVPLRGTHRRQRASQGRLAARGDDDIRHRFFAPGRPPRGPRHPAGRGAVRPEWVAQLVLAASSDPVRVRRGHPLVAGLGLAEVRQGGAALRGRDPSPIRAWASRAGGR